MNDKMKKIIILFMATMFILTGCDNGVAPTKIQSVVSPDIKVYGADIDSGLRYFYVVDNKTGVVYIQFDGFKRGGITPALNADGTPMTAEQLGLR